MKTNNIKTTPRESNLPESDHRASAGPASAPDSSTSTRTGGDFILIDHAKREANRQLSTEDLLALLRTTAPHFYDLAEIVGKWVWIHFEERQPRAVTAQLAQLGFHWNNARQTWQHPCGVKAEGSRTANPREKYGSQFAADLQPA